MTEKKDFPVTPEVKQIESNETFEKEMFTIVNHNGEFMIALGNQIVTNNKFENREAAEHYIDCKPWDLILNSCAVMWDKLELLKQQQTNKQ